LRTHEISGEDKDMDPRADVDPRTAIALYLERECASRGRGGQRELSKELGVSEGLLSGWMTGRGMEWEYLRAMFRVTAGSTARGFYALGKCAEDIEKHGIIPEKMRRHLASVADELPGGALVSKKRRRSKPSAVASTTEPTKRPPAR